MNFVSLLISLAVGAVVGLLAGTFMKDWGIGRQGSIIIGLIGGVVGGFLFRMLAVAAGGLIGSIVTATLGAVILLLLIGLFKKA